MACPKLKFNKEKLIVMEEDVLHRLEVQHNRTREYLQYGEFTILYINKKSKESDGNENEARLVSSNRANRRQN
ncbi:hypothetical protein BpHYR1_054042 [Brachionus plicatilis]|uniref:Uncharacterized protein n=1 Tax=Brachionus plicatilis TaxID=10195 RepID=A0A3M7QH86_BRAPC|nr:hypothetical protein BpHYR1_054042 [Brachionus plicatilis]